MENLYQKEWETYKQRNSLGCLFVLILIPLILILRSFLPQMLDYFSQFLFFGFILAFLLFMFFDEGGWKCPRCKRPFDYRRRITRAQKCINCGLPIYYGSSYFFDYWGIEQGSKLDIQIKDGNL